MIQVSSLDFGYQAPLFRGVDLTVEPGRVTGLLGKNGAGKTTLLKILCGLVEPGGGTVQVAGQTPRERRPGFLREIFMVPEQADLPNFPADRMADMCGCFYPRFQKERYLALLDRLEVPTRSRPSTMSFGQKRKALVAFGMATDASLFILDEPTNGFDISSQVALRKVLVEHVAPERTILISTHHIREFETILDDVVVLDEGRVVLHRTSESLQMERGGLDLEALFVELTSHPRPEKR